MAIGLLAEPMFGVAPSLPKPMKRLSLAQLADFFLEQSGAGEPVNVIKRAWSESKPVIHLASALEIYRRMAQDRGLPAMAADLQHIDGAIEEVLALAAEHERAILASPAFSVGPGTLIRFNLID
jgi:hypothetical protein